MGICCGYLILFGLLPMLTKGKTVQQPVQQQNHEKWQLEQLELQNRQNYGPWIQISSAVLQLMPDRQTQLLLLQTHDGSSSTTLPLPLPLPQHHIQVAREPRLGISDNLDFQQQPIKSHGR